MCVHTDRTLKLSGLRPLAFEKVQGGWNVAVEFPEKRPKGSNPVYKGHLGVVLAISNRDPKGRLDNAREVIFMPEIKLPVDGFMEFQTIDNGAFTIKGFSKFFKQADYNEIFNSLRQAKIDGSFIYKQKKSDEDNDNEMMVIQKDKDGNALENTYPMRYMVVNGAWVPQMVFNLETGHKPFNGIPSRTEKKPIGKIIPTVSGERAGVSGAWNPVNGNNYSRGPKGGFTYLPELKLDTVKETPLEQLKKEYDDFENGITPKLEINIPATSFNAPRFVKK